MSGYFNTCPHCVSGEAHPPPQEREMIPLTPEQIEIRLQCLQMAVAAGDPSLREQFLAFVTGESDQTPRQKIDAALDEIISRSFSEAPLG